MPFNFRRFTHAPTNRILNYFKIYSMTYAIIELALISASAAAGLYLQFELCVVSISSQAFILLSIVWMLYKDELKAIKYNIYFGIIALLINVIILPILLIWAKAANFLCNDIISYSTNAIAKSQCTQLLTARAFLGLILVMELAFKFIWIIVCLVGYKGKIMLLKTLSEAREKRRLEKLRELEALREKERRRKERRRKELKDKILSDKVK